MNETAGSSGGSTTTSKPENESSKVEKPLATTTPPLDPPPDATKSPVVKKVIFTRTYNGRWEAKFVGNIKRTDISHLVKRLRIDFSRLKRDQRVKARKEQRLKESQNEQ